jgi:hypothetical protein
MSDLFQQEMAGYTDERLLNMVKQAHNFDSEAVQVAKKLALERNLATSEQLDNWSANSQQMAQTAERKYEQKEDKGTSPWTILFVVFIVIRIIIAIVRNA